MIRFSLFFCKLGLLILALFGTACSPFSKSPGRSYYVLSTAGSPPSRSGIGVGVGPINLAPFLTERQNLLFQSSPNRLEFSADHLWAGDLEKDFSRVLARVTWGVDLALVM